MQQVERGEWFWRRTPGAPELPRPAPARKSHRFRISSHTPLPRATARTSHAPRRNRGVRYVVVATLVTVCALAALRLPGDASRSLPSVAATLDRFALAAGFTIDQVHLTGQRYTADSEIFAALDLASERSILTFDSRAARERIERLPWVASAEITRLYPSRLAVSIAEREPYAVWQLGDDNRLIDATGRILGRVQPELAAHLPRIAGEGAPEHAPALFAMLPRYPDIARRIEAAERVGNRRWTLRLKGDVTLHLPVDREEAAFRQLTDDKAPAGILDVSRQVIDMRVAGRMTVRTKPADAAASATADQPRS